LDATLAQMMEMGGPMAKTADHLDDIKEDLQSPPRSDIFEGSHCQTLGDLRLLVEALLADTLRDELRGEVVADIRAKMAETIEKLSKEATKEEDMEKRTADQMWRAWVSQIMWTKGRADYTHGRKHLRSGSPQSQIRPSTSSGAIQQPC